MSGPWASPVSRVIRVTEAIEVGIQVGATWEFKLTTLILLDTGLDTCTVNGRLDAGLLDTAMDY